MSTTTDTIATILDELVPDGPYQDLDAVPVFQADTEEEKGDPGIGREVLKTISAARLRPSD